MKNQDAKLNFNHFRNGKTVIYVNRSSIEFRSTPKKLVAFAKRILTQVKRNGKK